MHDSKALVLSVSSQVSPEHLTHVESFGSGNNSSLPKSMALSLNSTIGSTLCFAIAKKDEPLKPISDLMQGLNTYLQESHSSMQCLIHRNAFYISHSRVSDVKVSQLSSIKLFCTYIGIQLDSLLIISSTYIRAAFFSKPSRHSRLWF